MSKKVEQLVEKVNLSAAINELLAHKGGDDETGDNAVIGTKLANYAPPSAGPFKCSNCIHYKAEGTQCCHPEVLEDEDVPKNKEGMGIVDPEGCCKYFRSDKKNISAGGPGSGRHPSGMGEKKTPLVKTLKSNVAEVRIYHDSGKQQYRVFVNDFDNKKQNFRHVHSVEYFSHRNPKVSAKVQRGALTIAQRIGRWASENGNDVFEKLGEAKSFYDVMF